MSISHEKKWLCVDKITFDIVKQPVVDPHLEFWKLLRNIIFINLLITCLYDTILDTIFNMDFIVKFC